VAVISDPASRARLIEELSSPADFWLEDWDRPGHLQGEPAGERAPQRRTIGELARERGQAPIDTALDLVLEDGQYWIAPTIKDQGHLDRLVASPLCVPIGDGFANHPEMHRAYGLMPKSFGTFPLVLGSYVRDRGVLTLEEGIHKITGEPARRLGLTDRGMLAPGLAVGPRGVRSGDHREPGRPRRTRRRDPRGSTGVMVNGAWAVSGGRATGERAGLSL
jgi:N-acyl-D-aspartate/D-glutamate deacylase